MQFKSLLLFILLLILKFNAFSQGAVFERSTLIGAGSVGNLYQETADGNLLVMGYTGNCCNTFDLDAGPDTALIYVDADVDAMIALLDSNGHILWYANPEATLTFFFGDSEIDAEGNIYISGGASLYSDFDFASQDTFLLDFGPPGTLPNLYTYSYFAKYKPDFSIDWIKYIYAPNSVVGGISLDPWRNTIAVGRYADYIYFNPPDTLPFHQNPANNQQGTWVAKYDSLGDPVWQLTIDGDWNNTISAGNVETDEDGNIYIAGFFDGSIDFDPGPGTAVSTTSNLNEGFVLKLDSAGNYIWHKQIEGYLTTASLIGIDTNEYIYLRVPGSDVDLDPGPDTLLSDGQNITNIVVLDAAGNLVSGFAFPIPDVPVALIVDTFGTIYSRFVTPNPIVVGNTYHELAQTTNNIQTVASWTYQGDLNWARGFYSENWPASPWMGNLGLYVDPSGQTIYLSGECEGTPLYTQPNQSVPINISNPDSSTLYGIITKLSTCQSADQTTIDTIQVCPDDTVVLPDGSEELGENAPFVYNQITIGQQGCNENLTVFVIPALTTGEKLIYDTVCVGSDYSYMGLAPSIAITESRIDTIVPNPGSCDTAFIFILEALLDAPIQINNLNDTLYSNIEGDSLQWYQCFGTQVAIPGATDPFYALSNPGQYAVEVFEAECSTISSCFTVFSVGVDNPTLPEGIQVYPNPNAGQFTLLTPTIQLQEVKIYSATGQLVKNLNISSGNRFELELTGASGLYFIEVHSSEGIDRFKVIKE